MAPALVMTRKYDEDGQVKEYIHSSPEEIDVDPNLFIYASPNVDNPTVRAEIKLVFDAENLYLEYIITQNNDEDSQNLRFKLTKRIEKIDGKFPANVLTNL